LTHVEVIRRNILVVRELRAGIAYRAIKQKFHLSQSAISRIARQYGLPKRTGNE